VELTPAGRDLLAHARVILAQAELAAAAMRQHSKQAPALRIGAVQGRLAASELTLPILRGFRETHPDVQMQATTLQFSDQVGPLLADEIDVALVRGPLGHPDLELVPLAQEPRALLISSEHELAGETEVDVQDVLKERTIAPESWSCFWQLDDLRGTPNPHPHLAPARSVREMHHTVVTAKALISTSPAVGRMTPAPQTRCVTLRGAEPSTIFVARRRRDRRASVQTFIQHAVHVTHTRIDLLPGATAA
jgi:DNA-binding transcriptional LysR family regulator